MAYRRRYSRPRRRKTTRRRSTAQRLIIQVVDERHGVMAAPSSLGSKSLVPLKARF